MERLVAHFTITLAEPILVQDRQGARRTFKVGHDGYEVELTWNDEDVASRMWKPGLHMPYYGISRLNISVSHPETEQYPEGPNERVSYIEPRLEAYASVGAAVINRLIRYIKFTLGNPLLQEVTPQQLINSNPEWMDENGIPLQRAIVHFQVQGAAGLRYYPALGIKSFTPAQSDALKKALQEETTSELVEELIADARDALVEGNLRRAVLEMAIACEVATKQLFAKKGRRAGSNIPVALHTGAKKAFGVSFKQDNPKDWHHIGYLFQCRDDVAHGSIPSYRDKDKILHNMDFDTLRDWWDSLDALIGWIRST